MPLVCACSKRKIDKCQYHGQAFEHSLASTSLFRVQHGRNALVLDSCIYIYIDIYIYICIHICMCMCIYIYMYVYIMPPCTHHFS